MMSDWARLGRPCRDEREQDQTPPGSPSRTRELGPRFLIGVSLHCSTHPPLSRIRRDRVAHDARMFLAAFEEEVGSWNCTLEPDYVRKQTFRLPELLESLDKYFR